MDGFERRKEHSKEDIRRAAEELFSRFGTDKVSINDIARQAGVSQATIYNNFGSKEALVHDYKKNIMGAVSRRLHDILVIKKSYAEKLQDLFQSWIELTDRYGLQTESRPSGGPLAADKEDHLASFETEMEKVMIEFLRKSKKAGDAVAPVSEKALLAYIRLIKAGMQTQKNIQSEIKADPQLARELQTLFLYGISGPSTIPNPD